jgi:hypothetical protein
MSMCQSHEIEMMLNVVEIPDVMASMYNNEENDGMALILSQ